MIVWLASYPRSGNTFFRTILNTVFHIKSYSLYNDRNDIGADTKTSQIVGHEFLPPDFNLKRARNEKKTYYIKTHELYDNRIDKSDKVIYLIRDGRESTLSLVKYNNLFSTLNKTLNDVIYGNVKEGSWGEHVKSWNPKNRPNTLVIKFEELTKEPIEFISIISNFLNIPPITNKVPSFSELNKINPKFFNTGKISSWENKFSKDEHNSFWLKNYQQMDEFEYTYKKPKNFENLLENNILSVELIKQNNFLINQSIKTNILTKTMNRQNQQISNISETLFLSKLSSFITWVNQQEKIIIYGAGTQTSILYTLMKDKIFFIVDRDISKQNTFLFQHRIKSPAKLKESKHYTILVTPLLYREEITLIINQYAPKSTRISFLNDILTS